MSEGTKRTIAQFARLHGLPVSSVQRAVRATLGLPSRRARDPNTMLHPGEQRQLVDALDLTPIATAAPASIEPEMVPQEITPELVFRSDPLAPLHARHFGPMPHSLYVHPDVVEEVEPSPRFRKRLSLALQHLAAHGRTAQVKGCKDTANRGWHRTPFGGNGGMQWYLWWAPAGNRPTKALGAEERAILVRAVRHHDDHDPLEPGALEDYLPFGPPEIEDEAFATRPWTPPQTLFVESEDPVRFVLGRPGSGKTTVLYKAIEARVDQRVLYLTWSRGLTTVAQQRFEAFAPVGVEVLTLDFVSLLGELCGRDVDRMPLVDSRRAFFEALGPTHDPGPWTGHEMALFAEVRAFLIGRAVPGSDTATTDGGMARLREAAYIDQRVGDFGRWVAGKAVEALDAINASGAVDAVFPELQAATEAIASLRADRLPPGFVDFDRIVVDEVQDLTLLDAAVIVALCRAIARARGFAPWVLVAGDAGQTVRPSGFDWGRLSELFTGALAKPKRYRLEENLRCPARIAAVVQRASEAYTTLEKARRPTKQSGYVGAEHSEAFLFHVDARSAEAAIALIEQLDELDDVIVLAPQADRPPWLPHRLHDVVRTPAEVKGLEYQSVVVLDPGRFMSGLRPTDSAMGGGLHEHETRTRIDQFRVALSRATETLAFVDVDASAEARALSLELLDGPVRCDPDDLVEHISDPDMSPEERVGRRVEEARALVDEVPRQAWRRATQAVRLLGDPTLPNGVASAAVRQQAHDMVLAVGARLLVDDPSAAITRDEIIGATAASVGEGVRKRAFAALIDWTTEADVTPIALFDALGALGDRWGWLRAALVPVHQRLRQQLDGLADDIEQAVVLSDDVEGWLGAIDYPGDVAAKARSLRQRGVDTLIAGRRLDEAQALLSTIDPPDRARFAQLDEAYGRHVEAAHAFEGLGAMVDAWRNWRLAGDWGRARALFDADAPDHPAQSEHADLDWLVAMQSVLSRRPEGLDGRLRPAERTRLAALMGGGPRDEEG